MRANSGSSNLLPTNIDCLKNVVKQNSVQRGNSVGCLDFSEKSKTDVLCWTLLVDFVQPVEGNQVVQAVGV